MQKVLPGYRDLIRPEILKLIPPDAKTILDVGCGSGNLGAALKQRQDCKVIGIEIHPKAAQDASKKLDRVHRENAQGFPIEKLPKDLNCIIFADILEHLSNPWLTLKNYASALSDNGKIVASIPLIDHPSIIYNLQRGIFPYKKAGITDITHLRFFTQTTIFQMFAQAGLKIIHAHRHPSDQNPQQLLLTAQKLHHHKDPPKATIIMLTHNGLEYTKQAIKSFGENTTDPSKLIVVDNNSTDGTQEYLHGMEWILTIENTHNLGFPAGINSALHSIFTPYFVIVNNDIIFTPRWLDILISVIKQDKELGILGVTSNNVSGIQRVLAPPYEDNAGLYKASRDLSQKNDGHIQYHPRIVFICTLIKTELLQKIGPLDERYGLGNFEDDDYCLRSIIAGYKTAFTKSVYIHHYGSKSFVENKVNYKALMRRNAQLFTQKWGQDIFYQRQKIYDNISS